VNQFGEWGKWLMTVMVLMDLAVIVLLGRWAFGALRGYEAAQHAAWIRRSAPSAALACQNISVLMFGSERVQPFSYAP
jgi:hypothetical protein